MKNISIIGAGYVGLVTGTCLSEVGNNVICVDSNKEKIECLVSGRVPIYEPGIEELIRKNRELGRLHFTTDIEEAVRKTDVIFIAVGTPPKKGGGADLSYVESVSTQIAQSMDGYKVIVEKSTVPAQTGEWVERTIRFNNTHDVEFDVVSNPEFLREGSAINDFMHPDRIVIGVESERARGVMLEIYEPFQAPIIITDIKSAELIKHASNSFLAMKISYINAVSRICEAIGADVEKVSQGMMHDRRIGKGFLSAGIGYGGSCFPKDIDAFMEMASGVGYKFELLQCVKEINTSQRELAVEKIRGLLWNLSGKLIGVLGLSFKPNTDDVRESPALDIIKRLKEEGARIKAYDPKANKTAAKILPDIEYCETPYDASKGVDALAILTDWQEFRSLDLLKIKRLMKKPNVFDGRNIFEPGEMKELGFFYKSIGR